MKYIYDWPPVQYQTKNNMGPCIVFGLCLVVMGRSLAAPIIEEAPVTGAHELGLPGVLIDPTPPPGHEPRNLLRDIEEEIDREYFLLHSGFADPPEEK